MLRTVVFRIVVEGPTMRMYRFMCVWFPSKSGGSTTVSPAARESAWRPAARTV